MTMTSILTNNWKSYVYFNFFVHGYQVDGCICLFFSIICNWGIAYFLSDLFEDMKVRIKWYCGFCFVFQSLKKFSLNETSSQFADGFNFLFQVVNFVFTSQREFFSVNYNVSFHNNFSDLMMLVIVSWKISRNQAFSMVEKWNLFSMQHFSKEI